MAMYVVDLRLNMTEKKPIWTRQELRNLMFHRDSFTIFLRMGVRSAKYDLITDVGVRSKMQYLFG